MFQSNAAVVVLALSPFFGSAGAAELKNLPLHFEPAGKHVSSRYSYVARGAAQTYYFGAGEVAIASPGKRPLRMRVLGRGPHPALQPLELQRATSNYLLGNRPSEWRHGVPRYARLAAGTPYPGIDLVYYTNRGELEYDFVVAAGADPAWIRLGFEGAQSIRISSDGELIASGAGGKLVQRPPRAFQVIDGKTVEVASRFRLFGANEVGFQVGDYDRARALTIDPIVVGSRHIGGDRADAGGVVTISSDAISYVGASTNSANLADVLAPIQPANAGGQDIVLARVAPDGTLLSLTYLGGSGNDLANAIAIDRAGRIAIAGVTSSADFPITMGAPQSRYAGNGDAFILILNPAATAIQAGTYLGGSAFDQAASIAIDSSNNIYLTGNTMSTNFPVTAGAIQAANAGGNDAFFAKLNSNLGFGTITYFGGAGNDFGTAMALDGDRIFFGGDTRTARGDQDMFIAAVTASTGAFQRVRMFGGTANDFLNALVPSPNGLLVGGQSMSSDFPVTSDAPVRQMPGNPSGTLTLMDRDLNSLFSTFALSGGRSGITSVAYDATNQHYLAALSMFGQGTACAGESSHSAVLDFQLSPMSPRNLMLRDFSCYNADISSIASQPSGMVSAAGTVFSAGAIPQVGSNAVFGGGTSDAAFLRLNFDSIPQIPNLLFDARADTSFFVPYTQPLGLITADFNGDRVPDLVTFNREPVGLSKLLSSLPPQPWQTQPFEALNPTSATVFRSALTGFNNIAITDLSNPDGLGTGRILIGVNNGSGVFTFRSLPATAAATNLLAGDLNNDGNDDLVFANGSSVNTWINDSRDSFAPGVFALPAGNRPVGLLLVDGNADDVLDIIALNSVQSAAGQPEGNLLIFYGDGAGGFNPAPFPVRLPFDPLSFLGGVFDESADAVRRIIDFNNDGFPDFAVATGSQVGLVLSRADAPGQFTVQSPVPFVPSMPPTNPRLRFEPSLPAVATEHAAVAIPNAALPMAAADFDLDGNLDLAAADPATNSVTVFRGDGKGGLARVALFAVGQTPSALKAVDYDNDGRIDLALTARNSSAVQVLFNRVTPPVSRLPLISSRGITNAGSFRAGPVSPGEIVTLFGTGIGPATLTTLQLDSNGKVATRLANTQLLFDGVPAPLIYVSSGQISAIVPYAVGARIATSIQVVFAGRRSNVIARLVAPARPAIFTQSASGSGAGAILNQDYSVNTASNPAARGSVIQIYATGEGRTNPAGVDGQIAATVFPKPELNVTATVDGKPATVLYAGAAPSLVAGVLQVNVLVPDTATPGAAVPVAITVGQAASQPGVTVAIR